MTYAALNLELFENFPPVVFGGNPLDFKVGDFDVNIGGVYTQVGGKYT